MSDAKMLLAILYQTLDAVERIQRRFEPVDSVSYFTDSEAGMEKLDGICMLIIAVGESLKNIDKITHKELLPKYPQVDWKGAKGMRDIISHHYFDVDAEQIYFICENKLEELADTLRLIAKDVEAAK